MGEREEVMRGWGGATAGSGPGECRKWAGLWLQEGGGVNRGKGRGYGRKGAGL